MNRYKANLPCVGIASFIKSPICEDLDQVDSDVAFLGIPYDVGIGFPVLLFHPFARVMGVVLEIVPRRVDPRESRYPILT